MNPVLILARNNLELTKRTIGSVLDQDVSVEIFVIDNDSTDDTVAWLEYQKISYAKYSPQIGVSAGWNRGLYHWFAHYGAEHVLVLNNDVALPRWFYGELLCYKEQAPFVTGVAIDDPKCVEWETGPPEMPLVPYPDFSAFLIFREAWEALGDFDERMKFYSSDQDYHIRGWFKGVLMAKANVPYYHIPSATLRNAGAAERDEINRQADKDRAVLREKWGVSAGGEDYLALFSPENYGRDKVEYVD